MMKLTLAAVIAVSFVSVQAHVQRVHGIGAAEHLVNPSQPSSPLPGASLGSGTTRAIEKDRQVLRLDCCKTGQLALALTETRSPGPGLKCSAMPPTSAPPPYLRI
jgi:hypothetical protein